MGGLDGLPPNGDFSQWRSPLIDVLQNECPSDGWRFQTPSMRLGFDFFRNGFSNEANALSLGNVLLHEESVAQYYFGRHLGSFFVLLIGLILLLIAIFAALAINRRIRGFVSKWCWGCCRQRTRIRMKAVPSQHRKMLLYSNGIGCLLVVIGAAFVFALSAQGLQGLDRTVCSMWMEVYGHFFGTSEFENSEVEQIAMGWSGTYGILQQLEHLDHQVKPSETNPIYQALRAAYEQLQIDAHLLGNSTTTVVSELVEETRDWQTLLSEASGHLTGTDRDRWILPTSNAAVGKGHQYVHELNETLATGWVEIERLLAAYAGPDSRLMQSASSAVVDTIETIRHVDLVGAVLALTWETHEGTIKALVQGLFGLNIALAAISTFTAISLMTVSLRLIGSFRSDALPSRKERKVWTANYVVLAVMAGLLALSCGLNYTAAVVGWDVCHVADQFLMVEGRWELLPDMVMQPRPSMSVSVPMVLDTCVREDGSGNVAATLGLDGRIAELADDVEDAKTEVRASRDAMLQRHEKVMKSKLLHGSFRDLLETTLRRRPQTIPPIPYPVGHVAFNETSFVRMDWFEPRISEVEEYPGLKSNNDGVKSILCIVPEISTGQFLDDCVGQGLQFNVVPLNIALDRLNDEAEVLHQLFNLPTFPRTFCTAIARRNDYAHCDAIDHHMITTDTHTLLESWMEEIKQEISEVSDESMRQNLYAIEMKIQDIILQIINVEELAAWPLSSLNPSDRIQCPNGQQECTFDEARAASIARMGELAGLIVPRTLQLLSYVDHYVDGVVTPVMDELVEAANNVTEDANCQFEGTALRHAVLPPLCESIFPAFGLVSILAGTGSVILCLLAFHTWKWYHYMEDLAQECHDDPLEYEVQKVPTTLMSARPEYIAFYTGVPGSSPPVLQAGSNRRG